MDPRDYRIELTIRNNRIIEYMHSLGYKTVSDLCRANPPMYGTTVGLYINLKARPVTAGGEWKKSALDLANALHCEPDDLWSPNQRMTAAEKNVFVATITEQQMSLMRPTDEKAIKGLIADGIDDALTEIPERSEDMIRLRFGMRPYYREHTLEEIGQKHGVKQERTRQIIEVAMRKLRQPGIRKLLE